MNNETIKEYTAALVRVIAAAYRGIDELAAKINHIKQRYSPEVAGEKLNEVNDAIQARKQAGLGEIDELTNALKTKITEWLRIKDSELTDNPDYRLLLNPVVQLTEKEITEIAGRNAGNPSMIRALNNHARARGLPFHSYEFEDIESRLHAVDTYAMQARNALRAEGALRDIYLAQWDAVIARHEPRLLRYS